MDPTFTPPRRRHLTNLSPCRCRDALARWRTYFHFRLAEHSLTHAGPQAAGEALAQLVSDASLLLTPTEHTLHLLCRATLALAVGDTTAASPLLEQVWQGQGAVRMAGGEAGHGGCSGVVKAGQRLQRRVEGQGGRCKGRVQCRRQGSAAG